jgi:N-acetylglucosaminyldiphosphoundecaprenol N-acetyl-beta-D-mannosaminyltransferase
MHQQLVRHLAADTTEVAATPADLQAAIQRGGRLRVQTVNLHHVELAQSSADFRTALVEADLLTADGWPVVRTMRALGRTVERVTGSELTAALLDSATLPGVHRVGLLGATVEAGDTFSRLMTQAGRHLGYREHGRHGDWSARELLAAIEAAELDLLLVAVTPPAGDLVAAELVRAGLEVPVVPVGGSVDMLCGITRRAPGWVGRLGMEWLFRFAQEPRRLFRRYFVGGLGTFVGVLGPVLIGVKGPQVLDGRAEPQA